MALWTIGDCKDEPAPFKVHPRAGMCISTNLLPDTKEYLLQLPLFQTSQIKLPIGGTKCKLTHLLNKCLPKRCQIRELTRVLSKYCLSDSTVRCLFKRMMFCTFCGVYAHCTTTPPFGIVVSLCSTLLFQDSDALDMAQRIKATGCCNKGDNGNQLVCLHVLREYLCVCVSTQPTLRSKLCMHFDWSTFEKVTFHTMQRIRMRLYGQCHYDNFDLSGIRILSKFASTLHEIESHILPESEKIGGHHLQLQTLLNIFCKLRATQLQLLPVRDGRKLEALCHVAKNACHVVLCSRECTSTGIVSRMRALCKNDVTFAKIQVVLHCVHCNTSETVARNAMLELLHADIFCYSLFEYELRDLIQQLCIRVHMLSTNTHKHPDTSFHMSLMYCTSCNTVANSYTTYKGKKNLTSSHQLSVKVVVDDDNGMLLCGQNIKHNVNTMGKLRTTNFDNCLGSLQCQQRALLVVPVCNKLIQLQNEIYSLCTLCGHILKVETGMQLICKACTHRSEATTHRHICYMCTKKFVDFSSILCFSITNKQLFELTLVCTNCLSYLCKTTRQLLLTRKQITEIYTRLQRKRLLTIPGNQYNFFHSKS